MDCDDCELKVRNTLATIFTLLQRLAEPPRRLAGLPPAPMCRCRCRWTAPRRRLRAGSQRRRAAPPMRHLDTSLLRAEPRWVAMPSLATTPRSCSMLAATTCSRPRRAGPCRGMRRFSAAAAGKPLLHACAGQHLCPLLSWPQQTKEAHCLSLTHFLKALKQSCMRNLLGWMGSIGDEEHGGITCID